MNSWIKASSAVAIVLACGSSGAAQADRAQVEALAQRAADRLRSLHDEADHLAADERTLLGDLRRLEIDRQIKAEELGQIERDTAQVVADLSELDVQVAALEGQEQTDAPRLRARLVDLYKLGQGRYLRLLLSTSEVQRLGNATRMLTALAAQDRARVTGHQRRFDELVRSRATLEERRQRLLTLQAEAIRAKSAADQVVLARNTLIREVDQRRDLNAQLSGELVAAQQKLQATLKGLASDASTTASSVLPMAPFRGDLAWPAAGGLRQAFGCSAFGGAASEGAPVEAVHDGTVAFAGAFAGFGVLVVVDRGGQAFSLYGNLRDTVVSPGTRVARGAAIGTVGVPATGVAGLYFELRIDGRPVDPVQWLRKR